MYVLGIDLGTSSLKGLLLDRNGRVVMQSTASYPLIHLEKGYSEQHPKDWVEAFHKVMNDILKQYPLSVNRIEGLAISGQMHGLVTLDKAGNVIRPAILWNDTRTTEQCENIMSNCSSELLAITKNKALEGFTLPKILWMQQHEPQLWQKVSYIMLPKDYLIWYLTGIHATDFSDAAGTLLLDISKGKWSDELLKRYNIALEQLPKLYHSTEYIGMIKQDILSQFNIDTPIKVMGGGADNACAAVGAGIVTKDIGLISIGTSGVFLSYEECAHDRYVGQLHLFNHGVPHAYYAMGVTLSAGHSLNWFKQTFAPNQTFDELLDGIEKVPCGSQGLVFTPYIVGERTPYCDNRIRGSFTGIDTTHTMKHFVRSVLEGITFSLKDCQQLMADVANKQFNTIISIGGGSKNSSWLQMQADIFNTKIVCLKNEEGPGLGAAMMASVGVGWYTSLQDAVNECVLYHTVISPIKENVDKYAQIYNVYRSIYPALKRIV